MDQLKMVATKLTMLSERRINFFLNNNVNQYFPPFMNLKKPGLTLAQGVDFEKGKNKFAHSSQSLYGGVRKVLPVIIEDRVIFPQLAKVLNYAKQTEILELK